VATNGRLPTGHPGLIVQPSQNALRNLLGKLSGIVHTSTNPAVCGNKLAWGDYIKHMIIAKSKLTARRQLSVPAEVRQRLGVGPGSVVERNQQDGQVVVRRAGRYTSEEVHRAVFPEGAPRYAPNAKEAIRKRIRKKHAGVESRAKQDDWSI
jgi:bifunctional DNA-binding transcriptional regulator/antitoxin component of YhaV-PrlF toxin-antitoxin module